MCASVAEIATWQRPVTCHAAIIRPTCLKCLPFWVLNHIHQSMSRVLKTKVGELCSEGESEEIGQLCTEGALEEVSQLWSWISYLLVTTYDIALEERSEVWTPCRMLMKCGSVDSIFPTKSSISHCSCYFKLTRAKQKGY